MATEWKLRDDFEAWVNNPHKLARRTEPGYTDEYEHPWTAGAWAAWRRLMYRQDERGTYCCPAKWVEAWSGEGGAVAGWCVCEVREYADGTMRVHQGEAQHLSDKPDRAAMHAIYLIASRALGA